MSSTGSSGGGSGNKTVHLVVGNTYRRLPKSQAPLDRTGRFHRIHDWTLFVDIISGDPDHVERVAFDFGPSFEPSVFYCTCPIAVHRPNGQRAWRFQTRQQSYGLVSAKITVRGCGGSLLGIDYNIDANPTNQKPEVYTFKEFRARQPLKYQRLPDEPSFGLELELTSAPHLPVPQIAQALEATLHQTVEVAHSHNHTGDHRRWKIVPDGSIVCSRSVPDCHTLELVSPILRGGAGLGEASRVLKCLAELPPRGALQVNQSMGFHVHVGVSQLSLEQLIRVCQNFIKYEDVFDSLVPPSRRTGSPQSNQFFRSNCGSVSRNGRLSMRQCLTTLAACADVPSLVQLMNDDGTYGDGTSRYFKLNLQNLVTGRQPTIEFRQHSATMSYDKVAAWVRLCVTFVTQSARLRAPSAFRADRSLDHRFAALFQFVVKDRALRDFYAARRAKLAAGRGGGGDDDSDGACCDGCARGGACSAGGKRRTYIVSGYRITPSAH